MNCQYCKKSFSTKTNLTTHQKKAKYCLNIQGVKPEAEYICKYCNKEFNSKHYFTSHISSHENNEEFMRYQQKLEKLEYLNRNLQEMINVKDKQLEEKDKQLEEKNIEIREYKDTIERVVTKAVTKPTTTTVNNTVNYVQILKNNPPLTHYHQQLWLDGITPQLVDNTNISQAWGNLLLKTIGDVNHLVDDSRKKTVSKLGREIKDQDIRGGVINDKGLRYFKDYKCVKILQFLCYNYLDIKNKIVELDRVGELSCEQLVHRSRLIKMLESVSEGEINEDMASAVNHYLMNSC